MDRTFNSSDHRLPVNPIVFLLIFRGAHIGLLIIGRLSFVCIRLCKDAAREAIGRIRADKDYHHSNGDDIGVGDDGE